MENLHFDRFPLFARSRELFRNPCFRRIINRISTHRRLLARSRFIIQGILLVYKSGENLERNKRQIAFDRRYGKRCLGTVIHNFPGIRRSLSPIVRWFWAVPENRFDLFYHFRGEFFDYIQGFHIFYHLFAF